MARGLRAPRGTNDVDGHHISIIIATADDASPEPGAKFARVTLADEARKTKGRDTDGNDHYRPLSRKLTAQELKMEAGELFDALALEALAADEARAAEVEAAAAAKP